MVCDRGTVAVGVRGHAGGAGFVFECETAVFIELITTTPPGFKVNG